MARPPLLPQAAPRLARLLLAAAAASLLILASAGAAGGQAPPLDPALCLAGMAAYARQHPDWEQRLNPTARRIVQVQRAIGTHGVVVAFGDGPGGTYAVTIAYWDGTDLFAAGLPRTLDGRPLTVTFGGPAVPAVGGVESPHDVGLGVPGCPGPSGSAAQATQPTALPRTGAPEGVGVVLVGVVAAVAGALLRRRSP